MTRAVTLRSDFTPEAFLPFGAVITAPSMIGARTFYSEWLGAEGLAPVFHTNAVKPVTLPYEVSLLEHHPHAAQAFIPLDVSRYVVTVAPSDASGQPVLDKLESFLVPGNLGVIYRKGVWHAGASVLDRRGNFAVLMWRGASNDDVMLAIKPIMIGNMSA